MADKAVQLCVGTCLNLRHLNGFLHDKNEQKQLRDIIVLETFWKGLELPAKKLEDILSSFFLFTLIAHLLRSE